MHTNIYGLYTISSQLKQLKKNRDLKFRKIAV